MLSARSLRARRVVFDRRQPAAGLPQAEADPDGAVAARAADFERPGRAARCHHQAQEAAVLFRHGEQIVVRRLDLLKQPGDLGRECRWRPRFPERTGTRRRVACSGERVPRTAVPINRTAAEWARSNAGVPTRERSAQSCQHVVMYGANLRLRDWRTETVPACRQPRGGLPGGGAAVGDAVGDADASEAAAGDEQPGWPASPRSIAAILARWPTSCCALARSHR